MPPFRQASIAAGSDCAVLRVTGEVDMSTAPQLREQVIQLASHGVLHIIADLRGVDFLDSAGLAALVGSLKRLRTRGGSFTLAVSPGRTVQLLHITGLARAFALHPAVLDAIAADQHWQAAITSGGHGTEGWCREHGLL
jgi:anti-sigma B factor antagonist